MIAHRALAAALAVAALLAGGCSKSEAPQVDAAKERQEAHDRARKDAFGAQVKAIDDAKALPEDINRKAQENIDKMDKDAK